VRQLISDSAVEPRRGRTREMCLARRIRRAATNGIPMVMKAECIDEEANVFDPDSGDFLGNVCDN